MWISQLQRLKASASAVFTSALGVDATGFTTALLGQTSAVHLTGGTTAAGGTMSFWYNSQGNAIPTTAGVVFNNASTGSQFYLQVNGSGHWDFLNHNATSGDIFEVDFGIAPPTPDSNWHHVWCSVQNGTCDLVVDGTHTSASGSGTWDNLDMSSAGSPFQWFGNDHLSALVAGNHYQLAECWYDQAYHTYSSALLLKFRSAGGHPVDLGSNGSTPTGSQPIIYLSARAGGSIADMLTNRGSGGQSWQFNGSATTAQASPSP